MEWLSTRTARGWLEYRKIENDTVIEIKLTQGYVTQIDAEDFHRIRHIKWFAHKNLDDKGNVKDVYVWGKPSATASGTKRKGVRMDRKTILLHRLLVNCPDGMQVDHRDGKTLDNRKSNLEIKPGAENMLNKRMYSCNKSGYNGIKDRPERQAWCVHYRVNGRQKTTQFSYRSIDKQDALQQAIEFRQQHDETTNNKNGIRPKRELTNSSSLDDVEEEMMDVSNESTNSIE
jgi:hypothetical protein